MSMKHRRALHLCCHGNAGLTENHKYWMNPCALCTQVQTPNLGCKTLHLLLLITIKSKSTMWTISFDQRCSKMCKLYIFLKSKDLLTFTVVPEQSALGWHLWGLPRSQTHISQPTFICWPGQYRTPATSHTHSSGSTHCCKWFITKPSGHQQPGVTNAQILRMKANTIQ